MKGVELRVAIDRGHGGSDPGAIAYGVRESTITGQVGLLLRDELRSLRHRPHLVQRGSLSGRASDANRWRADRFVSIHANAAATNTARGIETWFFPGSARGRRLAASVQAALISEFPSSPDRGVKEADFAVLRLTRMPAVLVELEFLTHPEARVLLQREAIQARYARAIAWGVVEARL